MGPCKCVPGGTCEAMPNRFRKVLGFRRWSDEHIADAEAAGDLQRCHDAIRREYGDGYDVSFCLATTPGLQPVILKEKQRDGVG